MHFQWEAGLLRSPTVTGELKRVCDSHRIRDGPTLCSALPLPLRESYQCDAGH